MSLCEEIALFSDIFNAKYSTFRSYDRLMATCPGRRVRYPALGETHFDIQYMNEYDGNY